ncbi:MAG: ABC transporter substrate-binding protein [Thermomicrobiales bacterium]|nr:ABC transporter substrate-binding protein [Thermomicrobiales bacterium]
MRESKILSIVQDFEQGKISRRELGKRFAVLGAGASVASLAVATGSATLGARLVAAQSASEKGYLTCNNEQQATYIQNFNPLGPAGGSIRWLSQFGIYEQLFVWNALTNTATPWLATSWGFNADSSVLTFKLREGITWNDGEAFNADDVVYTWKLLQSNDSLAGNGGRTALQNIDDIVKVDDYTVQFLFHTINTTSVYEVGGQVIVPEHIWSTVDDPVTFTNETPVGTGAWMLDRFEAQIYELKANENYWQEGRPYIPGLRMPAFPSNDSIYLAWLNGEVDWGGNFIPDIDNVYVAKDPDHFGYFFPSTGAVVALYMNHEVAPFDDPNVRKAVSMALDRDQIVNIAMYDYTHPADTTGLSDAFDSVKDEEAKNAGWTTRNVDEANRLLDEAGLTKDGDWRVGPDGNKMSYELNVVSGWSDWVQSCELMAGHLKEVGIEAVVTPYDYTPWFERLSLGNFTMTIGWGFQGPTQLNHFRSLMSERSYYPIGDNRAGENWIRSKDADVDALIDQAMAVSDTEEQNAIFAQMQKRFAELAPCAPLFPGPMWGQFNTQRFEGFPNKDDQYSELSPWQAILAIILNTVYPAGSQPDGWAPAAPEGEGNVPMEADPYTSSATPAA